MKVVIVESPSKAVTINKYLGKDFKVLASYGHVRDLLSKNGSVSPEDNFSMIWQSEDRAVKKIQDIVNAVKKADSILLATDPDREGEAIAWHVREVLKDKNVLQDKEIQRIVFYEITKRAVQEALKNPRDLDQDLIDAYLARRSLDYLVGFSLSPVLWTRLPGSKSAGRVQSVALRLVSEREAEIEAFVNDEYWSIVALFTGKPNKKLMARLTYYQGTKLDKLGIKTQDQAVQMVDYAKLQSYQVKSVDKKQVKRHPTPPFITSTLQQEASRKLRFGARKTMQIAQQLYEGIDIKGETTGLITYMRTDSINVAQEAINTTRHYIETKFGPNYLPATARAYKSKSKNAQEAHEAIRPTDVNLAPDKIKALLSHEQFSLYELIWKRLVASQMNSAVFDQVSIDIAPVDDSIIFRSTGSTLFFDGFLTLYEEGKDEITDDDNPVLPPLSATEELAINDITPNQHFTQPPPRFTEASLVKKMEELGIGRPSTYASIMSTLIDRSYIRLEKRQLIPETRGRLVTEFLKEYFLKYVEYDFTADLEIQLDEISEGKRDWKKVMTEFWQSFDSQIKLTKDVRISDVIDMLDKNLEAFIYPTVSTDEDPRQCPSCKSGRLSLKLSKFGGFIGCSQYPECNYTRKLVSGLNDEEAAALNAAAEITEPIVLGNDPKNDAQITLRKGPYGFYFQWGEGDKKNKPKRVTLPKDLLPQDAKLEHAISLTALPRLIGHDPESGDEITAALGRFGPYVKLGSIFASLGKEDDVFTVELERALELIAKSRERAAKKAEKAGIPGIAITKSTPTAAKRTSAKAKNSSTKTKAVVKKIKASKIVKSKAVDKINKITDQYS